MELSLGASYNRTNFSAGNYSWTRRYGGSVAYHFWASSSIEWSYSHSTERTFIEGLQDTTFRDQVYSLNWVQSLAERGSVLQPYFKVGLGQLNRDGSGSYAGGAEPPAFVDSLTGVLAAGLRVSITRGFGIRIEGTSYLQRFEISEWDRNAALTFGTSFYF
jgi:hypothetical protein